VHLFVTMIGCGWFDAVKEDVDGVVDDIEGLTNPLLAQAIVLGVEEPSAPELQPLIDAGVLVPGTGVSLFLADAASADQIEESLVSGAAVVLDTPSVNASVDETEEGVYTVDPVTGQLTYVDDQSWTLFVDIGDGEPHTMRVALPPAVDLDPPQLHDAGLPLDLDLTGQGYASTLIVVTDVATGDTTYTTQPESAEEVYEITSAAELVAIVTVPASAFPRPGTYALGVAGMTKNVDDDIEGMNTLLSGGMAGKMRIFPIIAN
jgi:hypothetical protein